MPNIGTPTRRNTYPAQALPHKLRSTKTNFFSVQERDISVIKFFSASLNAQKDRSEILC